MLLVDVPGNDLPSESILINKINMLYGYPVLSMAGVIRSRQQQFFILSKAHLEFAHGSRSKQTIVQLAGSSAGYRCAIWEYRVMPFTV
jgi:hypothetical protein